MGGPVGPGRKLQMRHPNPLAGIAHTRRVAAVAADGRYPSRQALNQLLEYLRSCSN